MCVVGVAPSSDPSTSISTGCVRVGECERERLQRCERIYERV